jgi:uncharacterized protein YndB with AHSA1/START domain
MTTNNTIVVTQSFKKSIPIVWNAITNLNQMKQWFFNNIEAFEPTVGFKTQFSIQNEGRIFTHLWTITEVIPFKKICYNWRYKEYEGNSTVYFELTNNETETTLTLTTVVTENFTPNIPEFNIESCRNGWNYFIKQNLKEYLEKKC